jgi:hypothetical protein
MRCLGIPNTKHFHDICLIEDAQTLYAKVRESYMSFNAILLLYICLLMLFSYSNIVF